MYEKRAMSATLPEAITEIADIMAALRHPDTGCPWDIKQTSKTIAPYTLEEAYEVVDAIETGTPKQLCDELGDLLLQVVFHAQMAKEAGDFDLVDVIQAISNKMVRRHPHVFGANDTIKDAQDQTQSWEKLKAAERETAGGARVSALDGVAKSLPGLTRAEKLQKRAARTGFDWPDPSGARLKVLEELDELDQAQEAKNIEHMQEEAGDLLFSCVNYLRKLGISAEDAMRHANRKFEERFTAMERSIVKQSERLDNATLEEMERAWQEAKHRAQT